MTPPPDPHGLPLTGERTAPGVPDENYWFQRHVVAYALAAADVRGATVLDAGCGEGYGLARLADAGAARVLGIDLDPTTVAHAERTYARRYQQIEVRQANLVDLPLADDLVDVVVSFQVIEHLWDVPTYLAELRRVLRPGGRLLVATPNRLTFTPGSTVPVNPFHVTEFTASELQATLHSAGFTVARTRGVHHGARLRLADRLLGRPLPQVLSDTAPGAWPTWLRLLVHRVRPSWFTVRDDALDASLDLLVDAGGVG